MGEPSLDFVGSASIRDDIVLTAARIRGTLGFDLEERARMSTWEDALRHFITQADDAGILVMCSGIAKSNTHRALDPEEFRGFSLADPTAPLLFINGKDTKSAQMFTLAHELAHVWLGESALTDAHAASTPSLEIERWCSRVADTLMTTFEIKEDACSIWGVPAAYVSNRLSHAIAVHTWEGQSSFTEAFYLLGHYPSAPVMVL